MEKNLFSHTPTSRETLEIIRKKLPQLLSEKRLTHTLAVEEEALYIARHLFPRLCIGEEYLSDISAGALLHDITKRLSDDEQFSLCEKYKIGYDIYSANGNILHSKTAAYLARDLFGINNFVFSAIFCHTTGREDMSIFDKIIFIADFTEKTRSHKACTDTRDFMHSELENNSNEKIEILDRAIIMSLKFTVKFLLSSDSPIDITTINSLNFLLAEYALRNKRTEE